MSALKAGGVSDAAEQEPLEDFDFLTYTSDVRARSLAAAGACRSASAAALAAAQDRRLEDAGARQDYAASADLLCRTALQATVENLGEQLDGAKSAMRGALAAAAAEWRKALAAKADLKAAQHGVECALVKKEWMEAQKAKLEGGKGVRPASARKKAAKESPALATGVELRNALAAEAGKFEEVLGLKIVHRKMADDDATAETIAFEFCNLVETRPCQTFLCTLRRDAQRGFSFVSSDPPHLPGFADLVADLNSSGDKLKFLISARKIFLKHISEQ